MEKSLSFSDLLSSHGTFNSVNDNVFNIQPKAGDYELERKFRFNPESLPENFASKCSSEYHLINQWYIKMDGENLRIRKRSTFDTKNGLDYSKVRDTYYLTYKKDTDDPTRRIEVEKTISEAMFNSIYKQCVHGKKEFVDFSEISKIRYVFLKNMHLEVIFDFYPKFPKLCLCEVETVYANVLEWFNPQMFFDFSMLKAYGKEVTSDKQFSNYNISMRQESIEPDIITESNERNDTII